MRSISRSVRILCLPNGGITVSGLRAVESHIWLRKTAAVRKALAHVSQGRSNVGQADRCGIARNLVTSEAVSLVDVVGKLLSARLGRIPRMGKGRARNEREGCQPAQVCATMRHHLSAHALVTQSVKREDTGVRPRTGTTRSLQPPVPWPGRASSATQSPERPPFFSSRRTPSQRIPRSTALHMS